MKNTDTEFSPEPQTAEPSAPSASALLSGKPDIPSVDQLEKELDKVQYKKRFGRIFRSTVFYLVVVAALAVLVAVLVMPMLQIMGSSMSDTLNDGDIVVALHGKLKRGDVVAFYYNNTILIKRVIATEGQWVNIDEDGTVYVDGKPLEEPYLSEKAFGETNIELPYQVPDARYFVMGDHRSTSIDSRNTAVGCVSDEMIIGRIYLRVWPLKDFGAVR